MLTVSNDSYLSLGKSVIKKHDYTTVDAKILNIVKVDEIITKILLQFISKFIS